MVMECDKASECFWGATDSLCVSHTRWKGGTDCFQKKTPRTEGPGLVSGSIAPSAGMLPLMQAAIDRMSKAYIAGRGVRLSWEELEEFSRSRVGEWFEEENPCKTTKL